MSWEYKILEPSDYGHPGAGPRFSEFVDELNKLAKEGWEVVQLTPSLMRGRLTKETSGKDSPFSITTVVLCALLRREIE